MDTLLLVFALMFITPMAVLGLITYKTTKVAKKGILKLARR